MAEVPPYKVGDRVNVPSFGVGTVKYCNTTQFQTGMWVGVQLDTANGKNDGSVKGIKYFDSPPNYGLFVRPTQVQPLDGAAPATPGKAATSSVPSTPVAAITPPAAVTPASVIPKPSASVAAVAPSPAPTPATPVATPKASSTAPATPAATPKVPSSTAATPASATPKAAPPLAAAITPPKTPAGGPPPLPSGGAPPPLPGGPPPLPADSPGALSLTSSPELKRMLAELKELIEWKDKAQENIKGLQKQLTAASAQSQTLTQELDKEKRDRERVIEKATREFEREKERLTQATESQRTELQEQLTTAKDQLEMAQLDQQIEAEKANQLEKELENLRGKLEVLEAQQPKNVTVLEGATENERMLLGQCERLKEALMKLRDISVVEKQEHEKKLVEVTKRAEEVGRLEEKISRLDAEMQKRLKEIEELKAQLDELADAQRMVEELTEKNLNLEEYMDEQKASIAELEQLKEMSEELEENQHLVEKRLRSDLYAKEIQMLDVQTTLHNTHRQLTEQAGIIDAFRFKVRNLERDLGEVRKREEDEVAQSSQLNEKSQVLLEQNMQLRNRAQEQLRRELEAAAAVLEARTARSQVSLMRAYLPDEMQADWSATEAITHSERIEGKAELAANEVKRSYKLFAAPEARARFGAEEISFAHSLCIALNKTSHAAHAFWEVLNRCDADTFLRLGSVLPDLKLLEGKLDALLKLVSRDDLNEAYPIDDLNNLVDSCNASFAARAKGAVLLVSAWRDYFSVSVEMQHRVAAVEALATALASACGISAESGVQAGNEASSACRALTKTLTDAKRLLASDHIRSQLTAASASLQSLMATLLGSLAQLKDKVGLQVDVSPEIKQSILVSILQAFANKDAVSDTKLSADSLYELLVTSQLGAAHKLLVAAEQTITTALSTADTKDVSDPTPAWRTRAMAIRADIHSIPTLRDRADKAAAEVAERSRLLQQKEQEALEFARRETLYNQRLEALAKKQEDLLIEYEKAKTSQMQQIKMYEDALEALRQEVAAAEIDGRELKSKLTKADLVTTILEARAANAPKAVNRAVGAAGVEASPEEVTSLKEALNAVLRENQSWKGQIAKQDMLWLGTVAATTTAKASSLPAHRAALSSLYTQTQQLLAAPPMLSLTDRNGANEWEAKWALRDEKLRDVSRKVAKTKPMA